MKARTYYAIPGHYTIGVEFETLGEAMTVAVNEIDGAKRSNEMTDSLIPLHTWVDERISDKDGDTPHRRWKVELVSQYEEAGS